MNNGDTLEKLNLLQKVGIAASGLQDAAFAQAELTPLGKADLADIASRGGVPYQTAARAWDSELLARMTSEFVSEAGAVGARLFVTPDLKAVAPYSVGLSEDAYFNGVLGRAVVRGIHAAGGAAGLNRPSLQKGDIALLDKLQDGAAVHELAVKPYSEASREGAEAIFMDVNRPDEGYDFNRTLFVDALGGYFGNAFVVGEGAVPTAESLSLLKDGSCVEGVRIPLERAALRFQKLAEYRAEGSMTERDVEDAIREGEAFDTDTLDEVVDGVLSFCNETAAREIEAPPGDTARRAITEASIVLLKNQGILPLATGKRIAVVGEPYGDMAPLAARYEIVGSAPGYERNADRNEELIPAAVRCTAKADAVLVFLHPGKGLTLPANRIALLAALARTRKPLIALVCGDTPCDMSFDERVAASLLVPADGPYSCEAVARVLSGETDPAGRLTHTLYDGADARLARLKELRNGDVVHMGGFYGYLRYDMEQEEIRYPFGYGLSYTKFAYSKLSIEEDAVTFTVKNTGRRSGCEVAQIYIGAPSVSRLMPKKQLKAFRKIELGAGESETVRIDLPRELFATYDERVLEDTVEAGTYHIYVASSALDVKLEGELALEGEVREGKPENPALYFSDTDHFERNDREEKPQPPKRLIVLRRAAIWALPVVAVVAFLLATVLVLSTALDYGLVSQAGEDFASVVLFILAAAVIGAIPIFGSFNRKRLTHVYHGALAVTPVLLALCVLLGFIVFATNSSEEEGIALYILACITVGLPIAAIVAAFIERELRRTNSGTDRWAKYYKFSEPKKNTTPVSEVDEAFRMIAEQEKKKPSPVKNPVPMSAVPQFYDRSVTYPMLVNDLTVFLRERGIRMEENEVRRILATLTASQLIVIPEGSGARLFTTLSEYFGKAAFTDNAESYARGSDLFSHWHASDRDDSKTGLRLAVEAAQAEPAYLFTAILRHVTPGFLEPVLKPLTEMLARKRESYSVSGEMLTLPPNLRIIVEVGTSDLPASVAEVAACLKPAFTDGEEAARKTALRAVGYERFSAMRRAVRDEFPLPESEWKYVDALDARCPAHRIGNLLWIRVELHASVQCACGAQDAVKDAVKVQLLPWLSAVWEGEPTLSETLAEVFGADFTKEAKK